MVRVAELDERQVTKDPNLCCYCHLIIQTKEIVTLLIKYL